MDTWHIDYETRSELDLQEVGFDNYVKHPSTRVILCAYAEGDRKPKLWQPHLQPEMPSDLQTAFADPFSTFHAWNAGFEIGVSCHVLGIHKPVSEWRCTMVQARYMSLPGSLGEAGRILGLQEDEAKDKAGKGLIRLFCQPSVPAGGSGLFGPTQAGFRDWSTDPKEWREFGEYCIQDVVSERAQAKRMAKYALPEHEWETWFLDRKINETGWPVDLDLVKGAGVIIKQDTERLNKRLTEITGLSNPNSVPQLLPWLRSQNYVFSSLEKTFVARALAGEGGITPEAREALIIRGQTSKSSVKKYSVISNTVSSDGRLRYQYTFMGAARTHRWAAHGANVGNLPKPEKNVEKRMELAVELVQKVDYERILKEFGNPLDVVSSTVRPAFKAPKGYKFVVCDLAAIENIMLSYICRCAAIRQVFVDGRDPYLDFATRMYNQSYEELLAEYKAGDKSKRTIAKPATLACFAEDTEVLTNRGWVAITSVRTTDLLWDGEEWVGHSGVAFQGTKEVINLYGVSVTRDHQILTKEGWKQACRLNQNIHYAKQATDLAIGSLFGKSVPSTPRGESPSTTSADVHFAALKKSSTKQTWNSEKADAVSPAQTLALDVRWEASTRSSMSQERSLTGSQIGTTPSCPDAVGLGYLHTGMQAEELLASSTAYTTLLGTASRFLTTTKRGFRLTERTTTGTTHAEIFDLSLAAKTSVTKKHYNTLSGTARGCLPLSSGSSTALGTGTGEQSAENCVKDSHPSRSFPTKTSAEVLTYDILNAGPRHRFLIRTTIGPMIVHNCGYAMGPGEESIDADGNRFWSGLMEYARAMKIEMSQEEATRSVKIFREAYPEVTRSWKDFERAAIRAIKHPGELVGVGVPHTDRDRDYFRSQGRSTDTPPIVSFRCSSNKVLEMLLPSGRSLHYIDPRVDEVEKEWDGRKYTKQVVSYFGKEQNKQGWGRVTTSGGKFLENSDQSIARDVLVNGMKNCDAAGFEIVGHTYDEIVALVPENGHLGEHEMEQCMIEIPWWCDDKDLPLRAEAFSDTVYQKR